MFQCDSTRNLVPPPRTAVPPFARRAPSGDSALFNGTLLHVAKAAEIYREGDSIDCWYKVQTGAVCTHKILMDGRRQIASFYLPGDAFGFADTDTQCFAAEALAATTLLPIKRKSIQLYAGANAEGKSELATLAMLELVRAQRHLLMLSQTAPARMAAFLIDMCERLKSGCRLELPMGRRYIADYLGLTVETVCRTFAKFEQNGLISLESSRRIIVRDLDCLKSISD